MTRFFLPLLALAAACTDYDMAGKSDFAPADTGTWTDADDTGDEDDTSTEPTSPAWYVVRADLTVAEGMPTADGAVVTIEVVDEDLERTDCIVPLLTDGIAATAPETDRTTILWWEVPVVPTYSACASLPEVLTVGLGEMHPDVRARLGSVGHDSIAESLYGAYLLLDGLPAVFGYAGTEADLLGDDVAVTPPPDGLYRLSPLYLVPLPE